MTPVHLIAAGEALYGERWKSPLARDLYISRRTIERWSAGEWPIPEDVWPAVKTLLRKRADAIKSLL